MVINGTNNADMITGTAGDDSINGAAGSDYIDAGDGRDNVNGGSGDDTVLGGAGPDRLVGQTGNDSLDGGAGDDYITGSSGNDTLIGGDGIDRVGFSGASSGVIVDLAITGPQVTGAGSDVLSGFENLSGTRFGDTLYGDDNANWIWGSGPGPEGFTPTADALFGRGGDDLLQAAAGNDTLDGGSGTDSVAFSVPQDILGGLTLSLALQGSPQDTGEGLMTLFSIENISGTPFADKLTGDTGANILAGDAGSDLLRGDAGNDTLLGDGYIGHTNTGVDSGPITVFAETSYHGVDVFDATGQVVYTFQGQDLYDQSGEPYARTDVSDSTGTHSVFALNGQTFDFHVGDLTRSDGVAGADTLIGGAGDDLLDGGDGSDTVSYIDAHTAVTVSLLTNTATGTDSGNDTLVSIENIQGSEFSDNLIGDLHRNYLEGRGGNDTLDAGDGNDTVDGGAGNDQLLGGSGADTASYADATAGVMIDLRISGVAQNTVSAGMDTLVSIEGVIGSSFNDTIDGSKADNTLSGGDGDDVFLASAGVDVLSGGAGTDSITYAGFSHDYAISLQQGGGSISGGPEAATDTLSSIENIKFLDGTLSFDLQSTAAQIVRLYDSFLGRAPDVAGFDSYLKFFAAGHTFQDMADNAAASPEFHDATANLDDTQYITYVYEHSLNREPDPDGLQNYLDALHSGALTRTSLIVQAAESPEHVALTADIIAQGLWAPNEQVEGLELLYDAAVGRQPDATGLSGYGALLNSGTTFKQVANQMAASPEFAAAHASQTDAQYVDSLYVAEVGRHADAAGLAAYVDQLAHGYTRGDVLYETAMSQEHQSHVLAYYDPLLG